jgi:glycosyl transferase family 10 (putative fucosyltransferase)
MDEPASTRSDSLVVKFFAKGHRGSDHLHWTRQMPKGEPPTWGRCQFTFQQDATEYDWLVVYDDLAPTGTQRFSTRIEQLACPRAHTIFITQEPSSVKVYGNAFLRQFGHVLSSQEPWALDHPNIIRQQPALRWFYGVGFDGTIIPFENLQNACAPAKTRVLSTVCSDKRMGHTLHRLRYDFTQRLKSEMPQLDVFGRGVRPINDKAEALDEYKYHLAIENHICTHHWTEKLADAFLGRTLPLYAGCPNARDYFSDESFIPIDIRQPEAAIKTIRSAIANNEYEKRLPAILESRRVVLERYNIFAVLSRHIERLDTGVRGPQGQTIIGRHGYRNRHPVMGLRYLFEKQRVKRRAGNLH